MPHALSATMTAALRAIDEADVRPCGAYWYPSARVARFHRSVTTRSATLYGLMDRGLVVNTPASEGKQVFIRLTDEGRAALAADRS